MRNEKNYEGKIENCYFDKDLCNFEAVSYKEEDSDYGVKGLPTTECKSKNGLQKYLNDNITTLSKTGDWTSWALDSSKLDVYPVSCFVGSKNSSNVSPIVWTAIAIGTVVVVGTVIILFLKNKKKVS